LLRRSTKRARAGSGQIGLRGAQAHQLRNIEARQQPEVSAKSKTEPRILLTSGPVGSISRSHRDRSLRRDRVSTALRARVAAYYRRRGL
jgi:hypothetical protein